MILRARGVQCICSACQDPAITAELELAFELDRSIIELGSLGRVGQQSGLGNPLSHYMTNSKHQIGRIRESTMTSDAITQKSSAKLGSRYTSCVLACPPILWPRRNEEVRKLKYFVNNPGAHRNYRIIDLYHVGGGPVTLWAH